MKVPPMLFFNFLSNKKALNIWQGKNQEKLNKEAHNRLKEKQKRILAKEIEHNVTQGYYKEALKEIEKQIKLDPTNPELYYQLGRCYHGEKPVEDVIKCFTKSIELDTESKFPYSYFFRAGCYMEKKDFNEALDDLDKLIELVPDFKIAHSLRAKCYKATWQKDKLLEYYNQVIEQNPESYSAYKERAKCYEQKREFDKAIDDYNKSIELNKYDELEQDNCRCAIARIAIEEFRYDEALEIINGVLERRDFLDDAYYLRAEVHEFMLDRKAQIEDLAEVVRLSNNNASIHYRLAEILLDISPENSAKHFKEAMKFDFKYYSAKYLSNYGNQTWREGYEEIMEFINNRIHKSDKVLSKRNQVSNQNLSNKDKEEIKDLEKSLLLTNEKEKAFELEQKVEKLLAGKTISAENKQKLKKIGEELLRIYVKKDLFEEAAKIRDILKDL